MCQAHKWFWLHDYETHPHNMQDLAISYLGMLCLSEHELDKQPLLVLHSHDVINLQTYFLMS